MSDKEQWATIDLMGHAQTAGRISRPQDWGGLLRVDVPMQGEDGVETYRTEYYLAHDPEEWPEDLRGREYPKRP